MGKYCGHLNSSKNISVIDEKDVKCKKSYTCDDCNKTISKGENQNQYFRDDVLIGKVCDNCYDLGESLIEAGHKPYICGATACVKEFSASKESIKQYKINSQYKDRMCKTCKYFSSDQKIYKEGNLAGINCDKSPIIVDSIDIVMGSVGKNEKIVENLIEELGSGDHSIDAEKILVCGYWEK